MSDPATQPSLLQTIENDLVSAGNWLEKEVVGTAEAIWQIVKVAFEVATSAQARVIIDVFAKLQADTMAGKSLEEIESDMLNVASAEERAILDTAGSAIIQGFLAFMQASKAASSAP